MEQKIKLPDFDTKEDWTGLSDKEITIEIESIIEEALIINGVYYNIDDIDQAIEELLPIIEGIVCRERFRHLRLNGAKFVEFITYLTVRLG